MKVIRNLVLTTFVLILSQAATAQSTAFTFQGTLSGGNPNGDYDFIFNLYDVPTGGTPIFNPDSCFTCRLVNGRFTVQLNFGNQFPPGSTRYIEVQVRAYGTGDPFVTLLPRFLITRAPYAAHSLTADDSGTVGGIPASGFVQTNDARLTDARQPLPGSGSYIQNGTSQQASADFNIIGTGTANVLNANIQFDLGSSRVIGQNIGSGNLFLGYGAGSANTGGNGNSFFGVDSGAVNSTGTGNTFFGRNAGVSNTAGSSNTFVGLQAGRRNVTGALNTYLGASSGAEALGQFNVFVGGNAGRLIEGSSNTFVGMQAAGEIATGSENTVIGGFANLSGPNLTNATALGFRSQVSQNNSLVLGSINGVNGSTADTSVGIGTTAPAQRLHVVGNSVLTGNLGVGVTNPTSKLHVVGDGLVTGDLTVSGTINGTVNVGPGNPNYIQNTTTQQGTSNFNISGTGSANIFNAGSQFNIGGNRILSAPGENNLFVGLGSGTANIGADNVFIGRNAGSSSVTGSLNAIVGAFAGESTDASELAFFGAYAGYSNTTGGGNAFFGSSSGYGNTSGGGNSFFGTYSGAENTAGSFNTFLGYGSGSLNTTGSSNTFAGHLSGESNTTGTNNTYFGYQAGLSNEENSGNSFFGFEAGYANTGSDNSFFGQLAGRANLNGSDNAFFGQETGEDNTTGGSNSFFGRSSGLNNTTGSENVFVGRGAGRINTVGVSNTIVGSRANLAVNNLSYAGAIGADAIARNSNQIQIGRDSLDTVSIGVLESGGVRSVCLNESPLDGNIFAVCSSSIRYKTNVETYGSGLQLIQRLRPVTFNWLKAGTLDLGLVAEEVAKADPLLVSFNKDGGVEGVKYDRIGVVAVNAINEQQIELEKQRRDLEALKRENAELKSMLEGLKQIVCQSLTQQECTEGARRPRKKNNGN